MSTTLADALANHVPLTTTVSVHGHPVKLPSTDSAARFWEAYHSVITDRPTPTPPAEYSPPFDYW